MARLWLQGSIIIVPSGRNSQKQKQKQLFHTSIHLKWSVWPVISNMDRTNGGPMSEWNTEQHKILQSEHSDWNLVTSVHLFLHFCKVNRQQTTEHAVKYKLALGWLSQLRNASLCLKNLWMWKSSERQRERKQHADHWANLNQMKKKKKQDQFLLFQDNRIFGDETIKP